MVRERGKREVLKHDEYLSIKVWCWPPITVRPDDTSFLVDVYASTREQELELTDWNAAQKRAFCEMQFEAQDAHYRQNYTNTTHDIILVDGAPAGRLYVARWQTEIRIMDIA